MPTPQRKSPAIAGTGRPASQKRPNPAAVITRDAHSSGMARPALRVSRRGDDAAPEDAQVEAAHRGGGLGGDSFPVAMSTSAPK